MEIKKEWIDKAIKAAKNASQFIMEVYATHVVVDYKMDHSPVTKADRGSSKLIVEQLESTGIMIISEEEKIPDYENRKDEQLIWLVDPLDGTKEFIQKNDEFCICIGLVSDNKPIFGLIASPTDRTILLGSVSTGVYYFQFEDENPFNETNKIESLEQTEPFTIAHSRSHFSSNTKRLIEVLSLQFGQPDFIKKGSALKFIDLALNRAHFYPRMAPTMEWDIAAGQAIYEALGGEVLDFTTFEPLTYNKPDLHNPFFIAKNKNLNLRKLHE